jgi:hypothetical protein
MIVAIHFLHCPPEGAEFLRQGMQLKDLANAPQALDLIVVDDYDEVIELMMRREKDRFPIRTFIQFAVAHQDKRTPKRAHALRGQSLSTCKRESMSKRTGRKLHAGNFMADVSHQAGAIQAIGLKFLDWEKPAQGECRVHSGATMSFAKYKAIPRRPTRFVGANAQNLAVKDRQQIRHRKNASDMRGVRRMYHPKGVGSDELSENQSFRAHLMKYEM